MAHTELIMFWSTANPVVGKSRGSAEATRKPFGFLPTFFSRMWSGGVMQPSDGVVPCSPFGGLPPSAAQP